MKFKELFLIMVFGINIYAMGPLPRSEKSQQEKQIELLLDLVTTDANVVKEIIKDYLREWILIEEVNNDAQANTVATSKDGKYLISGNSSGKIIVRDMGLQKIARSLDIFNRINYLLITANNKFVIACSTGISDVLLIWNLECPQECTTILKDQECYALELTADEGKVVFNSGNIIKVWDLEKSQLLIPFKERHDQCVYALALSKDNRFLVSASKTGEMKKWDFENSALVGSFQSAGGAPHKDKIWALKLTDSGKHLASCSSDKYIKLWDFESLNELMRFENDGPIYSIILTRDNYIIFGDGNGNVKFWSLVSNKLVRDLGSRKLEIYQVILSNDNKCLIACGNDKIIRIWKLILPAFPPSNNGENL